jgi:phage terminase small subunit
MAGKPKRINEMDPQHVEFCHNLLVHWNGTKAAIQSKYAESNAHNQAHKLLKRQDVQDLLLALSRARLKKIDLEANDVLAGLGRIATYDLAEFVNEHGDLLGIHDIPEELRRCLASIKFRRVHVKTVTRVQQIDEEEITETVTTQVIEVKMPDRLKAYELIGRHLDLFSENQINLGEGAVLIIEGRHDRHGKAVQKTEVPDNGQGTQGATPPQLRPPL